MVWGREGVVIGVAIMKGILVVIFKWGLGWLVGDSYDRILGKFGLIE